MRDRYHELVKQALIAEGWTITDDPLYLDLASTTLEVDLGAERLIAAEKGTEKIAVEIKSFLGHSTVSDFYKAMGQFNFYNLALEELEPSRVLYLAMPEAAYQDVRKEPVAQKAVERYRMRFIVYSLQQQIITSWIE